MEIASSSGPALCRFPDAGTNHLRARIQRKASVRDADLEHPRGDPSTAERKLGTHFELASGPSHLPDGPARPFGQWSQNFRCPVLAMARKGLARARLPAGRRRRRQWTRTYCVCIPETWITCAHFSMSAQAITLLISALSLSTT